MRLIRKIANLKVSGLALSKLEQLASKIGVNEKEILKLYVEVKNKINRAKFSITSFSERIILLPQCLRPKNCPAKLGEYGYECVENCNLCEINRVISYAKKLGYKYIFILPGGSIIERIFRELKPKACLGIACLKELVLGSFICEKFNVASQGVPLIKDGCVNTEVRWSDVYKAIALSAGSTSK